MAGRVAQSVARLTQEPEVPGSIPGPATYFPLLSADSRRAVFSYWRKYVHEILVNRLGGLRPDFTSQLELRLTSSCFILS